MGFLKHHGEKLLLLLLLAGIAFSVLSGIASFSTLENPDSLSLTPPESDVNLEVAGLDSTLARLTGSAPQLEVAMTTFTPGVRVICINQQCRALIDPEAARCVYCDTEQTVGPRDTDGDGITDRQESEWNMDPTDPNDVFMDQDGDGFPTLYEFENNTDPTNASSTPELISFLRLEEVKQSSIIFELRGTAKLAGNYTLQLSWKYPDQNRSSTGYIRVGENFGRNNEFHLESFTEKRTLRGDRYVDESVAVIKSGRFTLELGRTSANRAGSITKRAADLKTIFGPEIELTVRVDETIDVGNKSYKVVDITEGTVVIKPDGDAAVSSENITIRRPTTEDERALQKFSPSTMDGQDEMNNGSAPAGMFPQDFF